MNNRLQLLDTLDAAYPGGVGAELGICDARFSAEILSRWSTCSKLYMVDLWRHQPEAEYRDGCNVDNNMQEDRFRYVSRLMQARYRGRFNIMRMTTHEAAKLMPDNSLDFVYIDANHHFRHVIEDINDWYPKVKAGGVFAGHDYVDGSLGHGPVIEGYEVPPAVDAFIRVTGLELIKLNKGDCSWAVRKP